MKPAILTSVLSPAAGGLAASVPALARNLAQIEGCRPEVFGVTDPHAPQAPADWGPVVHACRPRAPHAFHVSDDLGPALARAAPDIVDVQGLWTYPSLANLRHHHSTGTPYVVTPRGMLDPWARQRSWWKKRAVRIWFEDAHLASAVCLRATAVMEAGHFRSFGLRNPIAIVPNGVDVPDGLPPRRLGERRRLLFLSRIHPKKGLPHLLRAWARIEGDRPEWELVVAGPDEVSHTAEMAGLAKRLGLKRVQWLDAVHGEEKSALYRSADVFVLPTHAENFGLVVAEALAHEVPVITTRNAPWEGMATHRCGWWINLDDAQLHAALLEATSLPREALWEMGARGRAWMTRDFGWDSVSERMFEVYRWVISRGTPPECVTFD